MLHPNKDALVAGQRRIETDDSHNGKRVLFRNVRNLSQNSMSSLPEIVDRRFRLM